MTEQRRHIPDWLLEQYALGECPPAHAEEIDARLSQDTDLRTRLDAIKQSNETLLAAHPPRVEAAVIRQRLAETPRRKVLPLWGLIPAGAALALIFVVTSTILSSHGLLTPPGEEPQPKEIILTKGLTPHLTLYRKNGEASEALEHKARVAGGDVLRLGYVADGADFGVIFSIDGSGALTRHFPTVGEWAATLKKDGETLLPFAYELDNAPNFERFFFVYAKERFKIDGLLQTAKRLAADPENAKTARLPIGEGLESIDFLTLKSNGT